MALILITHFFNEEFLLPYWIEHHKNMFDHVILIDYQSTDLSVDIVRELAPEWDLRPSSNFVFDARSCDEEVMQVEQEFASDWKVALNTTEFILHPNLAQKCKEFLEQKPELPGFRCHGVVMVDPLENENREMESGPLIAQRYHGYSYPIGSRNRIIHHAYDGAYEYGRHATHHSSIEEPDNSIFCLWYGWSPMKYIRERKLQIQTRIPEENKQVGLGVEHLLTPESLQEKYESFASQAVDLRADAIVGELWRSTQEMFYP